MVHIIVMLLLYFVANRICLGILKVISADSPSIISLPCSITEIVYCNCSTTLSSTMYTNNKQSTDWRYQ